MATTRNPIQSWPLRNDRIVLMVLAGMPVKEVAKSFGLSQQMISIIVADPRAEEIGRIARARLQEKLIDTIEEELDQMARMATEKLKATLQADIGAVHKAKPNQDRVAVKILEGRGFLKKERGATGGLQIPKELYGKLVEAMEKANKAAEIDPFDDEDVQEAEFEVVGELNEQN